MNLALYTPTIRPGLCVSIESVRRQTRKPDLWILGDHLMDARRDAGVYRYIRRELPDVPFSYFNPGHLTDAPFTIQAGYNFALRSCRGLGNIDLLVSMEDYVWLPAHALARMVSMANAFPNMLLSGIVSGSLDPEASKVVNPEGMLTIFDEPYSGTPRRMDWEDCRLDRGQRGYQLCETQRWEPPFAAIPREPLHDERLTFNEEYDQGTTHGNQWFASLANDHGYKTMLDLENRAWALPHRYYWPEQRHDGLTRGDNKALHDRNKERMGWPDLYW